MSHPVVCELILFVQMCRDCVQAFTGHCFWFAEIGREESSSALAIGFPVPAASLVARTFFACREGTRSTAKGEGRRSLESRIPLGRTQYDLLRLPVPLIGERILLYGRMVGSHRLTSLTDVFVYRLPNSIPDVR